MVRRVTSGPSGKLDGCGDRTSSDAAASLLRAAGLRMTAPRCAALVWLDKHPAHHLDMHPHATAHGRWLILGTQ